MTATITTNSASINSISDIQTAFVIAAANAGMVTPYQYTDGSNNLVNVFSINSYNGFAASLKVSISTNGNFTSVIGKSFTQATNTLNSPSPYSWNNNGNTYSLTGSTMTLTSINHPELHMVRIIQAGSAVQTIVVNSPANKQAWWNEAVCPFIFNLQASSTQWTIPSNSQFTTAYGGVSTQYFTLMNNVYEQQDGSQLYVTNPITGTIEVLPLWILKESVAGWGTVGYGSTDFALCAKAGQNFSDTIVVSSTEQYFVMTESSALMSQIIRIV